MNLKIDHEKLRVYAEKSDDELWNEARALAARYGYNLSEKTPPHSDMERLRSIMLGKEKINMKDGMKILNEYKNRGG